MKSKEFKKKFLKLASGETFIGKGLATQDDVLGEIVFTTAMTDYTKTLTDPSYAGQIICFAYPLIGNYGVANQKTWESNKIQVKGIILSSICNENTHYSSKQGLIDWLIEQKIPFIFDVDTRNLIQILSKNGSCIGGITKALQKNWDPICFESLNLVKQVTCNNKTSIGNGDKTIIVVDCGLKNSQLDFLLQFPVKLIRVPYDYDFMNEEFDGVFISNGPGNPQNYSTTINLIKEVIKIQKPIFGICLGMQLLAIAVGAKTYKLKFGHRGFNQPCQEVRTKRCIITSQNHGYAVSENDFPSNWEISYINLNDRSIEGIKHKHLPMFAVQFHPEANGGPLDSIYLFENFYNLL